MAVPGDRDRGRGDVPLDRGERVSVTPDEPHGQSTTVVRREETGYASRPPRLEDRHVELPEALNLARDRVRWGPIWAGLVTALTTLMLLGLLGLAVGLTVVNAGTAAAQGGPPQETGIASAIWGAVSAILAFLLGGYVAGRTAAVFSRGWGALNGALVFLLAVPIMLWLTGQGLGFVLGTLGDLAGALNLNPSQVASSAQAATGQAQQAGQQVDPIEVARTAATARNAAWATLAGLLLGLGASALGGALGTRRELSLNEATATVTRD